MLQDLRTVVQQQEPHALSYEMIIFNSQSYFYDFWAVSCLSPCFPLFHMCVIVNDYQLNIISL